MNQKTKTRYDASFKAQCVEEVSKTYQGNIRQAAQALGLPMQTLHNWVKQAEAGKLPGTEQFNPELIALQEEIKVLKKSLKIAEMERDILKKATAYFAKTSQ